MARQVGLIKIEGTLGDLTFYTQEGEYFVKTKSSLTADQIANDPNFARTRENNREFAEAASLSKLIKQALSPNLIKDLYYFARLNAISYRSVRKDSVNGRGDRELQEGNEYDYYGFDFGGDVDVFQGSIDINYDRVSGNIVVSPAPFVPANEVISPPGATHFDFTFASGEIDTVNKVVVSKDSRSSNKFDVSSISSQFIFPMLLSVSMSSPHYVVACCTIRFWQLSNGTYYRLYSSDASALVLSSMFP